jgi:hypothetical protein
MEGKYTKIGTIAAVLGLVIAGWQLFPKSEKDFSGTWEMNSVVEEATMKKYIGMETEWVIHLTQSGEQISGTAEKISVNSLKLDYKDRTTLVMSGKLSRNKFVLNYTEKGRKRNTQGTFDGEFNDNSFEGIFVSTASDSKGVIKGKKMQ